MNQESREFPAFQKVLAVPVVLQAQPVQVRLKATPKCQIARYTDIDLHLRWGDQGRSVRCKQATGKLELAYNKLKPFIGGFTPAVKPA